MRILVTRPEPDALKLKARLEAMDHEAVVEPLMRLDFEGGDLVDLSEVQAIVATSRNALRALKHQRCHKIAAKLPAFVVGPGTAKEARALGFEVIVTGAGRARDLLPQIVSTLDPQAGFLLQPAGDALADDIAPDLQQHGFRVLQPVVYHMRSATSLSRSTLEQLVDGEIDAVMLLSPRTAQIWIDLVQKYRMTEAVQRLLHVCLSPSVARRLKPLGAVRVETPPAPALEELLALLA
jgi:uroporphyrinogen-III synthase